MGKLTNKILKCMATTAEDAFWEALGLASHASAYEPEMTAEVKTIKNNSTSKVEAFFNKLVK